MNVLKVFLFLRKGTGGGHICFRKQIFYLLLKIHWRRSGERSLFVNTGSVRHVILAIPLNCVYSPNSEVSHNWFFCSFLY